MEEYEYDCPVCSKVVRSRYREQFKYNTISHLYKHYDYGSKEFEEEVKEITRIVLEVKEGGSNDD